jgi:hypothetical protein
MLRLYPDELDAKVEEQRARLRVQFPVRESSLRTRLVDIAAVLWLPEMRWFVQYLDDVKMGCKTNRQGVRPSRARTIAGVLWMAFTPGKPCIAHARQQVVVERNLTLSWAFDWPAPATQGTDDGYVQSLHRLLRRPTKDPAVIQHLSVHFTRMLAEHLAEDTTKAKESIGVAKALVLDASFVEAHTDQRQPVRDAPGESVNRGGHAREIQAKFAKAAGLVITDENDEIRKSGVGWKWLKLICPVTNRVVIAMLIPPVGTDLERYGLFILLDRLYELWPDCPVEWILGDSLFGGDLRFIELLWRRYGLTMVTEPPANQVAPADSRGIPTEEGTPRCICPNKDRLMIPYSWDGKKYSAPDRRGDDGREIAPGVPAPVSEFRIRWRCPDAKRIDGKKWVGGCGLVNTYSSSHWGFVSALPHAGEHKTVKLRTALLNARNRVECAFSLMKAGVGNGGTQRAAWAKTREMEWMLGLASLWPLLVKVAHTPGLATKDKDTSVYDAALALARKMELLTPTGTVEEDEAGLSAEAKQRGRLVRDELCGPPAPPRTLDYAGNPLVTPPEPRPDVQALVDELFGDDA